MSPSSWPSVTVSSLIDKGWLTIGDGYRVRRAELGSKGTPFVRGGDIGDGWITTTVVDHVMPEFRERLTPKLTQPLDAAFITKGSVGRVGILRPEQPQVVFAPQVCFWRSLDFNQINPRFIFYLLKSHWFQKQLNGVKTSGSMVADYVSLRDQLHFQLPVPPGPIQRRIAAVLGALDDKIELNRKMNRTLEAIAQAIFKSWFVDFEGHDDLVDSELGRIPRGWRIHRLSEHIEVEKGLSYKGKYLVNDGRPLVNLNSILEGGRWKEGGLKFYSGPFKSRHVVEPGDLVVANTEQGHKYLLIGCPAMVPHRIGSQGIYTHHLYRVRPKAGSYLTAQFLLHQLLDLGFRQVVTSYTNGTTVNGLGCGSFRTGDLWLKPRWIISAT